MTNSLERTYQRDDSVTFRKTNEPFGGLSNMAPGFRVRVNGVLFLTVEALYQACRFPHIPDLQNFIIHQKSPMTLKMRIKQFRQDSRPDWDRVRVSVMRWCIRVKLSQNLSRFGSLLLGTGDKPIVEDSRKDPFWGAIESGDGILKGANVLGRLLMELREELRRHGVSDPFPVTPPDVPDLLILGKPIEGVESTDTQHSFERQGRIDWIPNYDVQLKLAQHNIDRNWVESLDRLLNWLTNSGLDFEAKIEIASKGGCSPSALEDLNNLLLDLRMEARTRTTSGTSSIKLGQSTTARSSVGRPERSRTG